MKNYKVTMLPNALLDVEEIVKWYEDQQQGLGHKFELIFDETLEKLKLNPYLSTKILNEVRRILMKKFPYRIFYVVNENKKEVVIHTVIYTGRDPKMWQKRVK